MCCGKCCSSIIYKVVIHHPRICYMIISDMYYNYNYITQENKNRIGLSQNNIKPHCMQPICRHHIELIVSRSLGEKLLPTQGN